MTAGPAWGTVSGKREADMLKPRRMIIGCLALTFALAFALAGAPCLSLAASADSANTDDAARAVALAERAAAFVAAHGQGKAVAAFHDPKGQFRDGELYILFYAFDGTCLANGAKPQLAGKNRYDVHDPDGVYQIREMIRLSKGDGGWVRYKYDNPISKIVEPKATYAMRAPGLEAFVACGIYGDPRQ